MPRQRLLYIAVVGAAALAVLLLVLQPRVSRPGTVLVLLAASSSDHLSSTQLQLGSQRWAVSGGAPVAPDTRQAAQFSLAPGTYPVTVGGRPTEATLTVGSGLVQPLLLGVRNGQVVAGGVYAGVENVNLGLQELSGRLNPIADFHLVDQDGQALSRDSLLGRDTIIAAFHTSCHETCPIYTGLFFQVHRSSPAVRLVEVTTDPPTDTPAALAAYRDRIGADWTFATGSPSDVAEFWGPLGVAPSSVDSHTSTLVMVDRYGFIRQAFTGVPDVGGSLPSALAGQLNATGKQELAGHGDDWGTPQVLDSLRVLASAGRSTAGTAAPAFSLVGLDGARTALEEFRGRPVILNFWWSGCSACQSEMPLLQKYADAHPETALLLVDPVDGAAGARAFVQSLRVRARVLLDPDGHTATAYRVAAYPTSVFIHSDGTISSTYPGALTADALAAHTANLASA